MRKEGTIVRWDDAKGFGFIRSGGSAQDVFVHARDFRSGADGSPRKGMRVHFDEIHVGGKGPRAMAVQPVGMQATPARGDPARTPLQARKPAARSRSGSPASGARWVLPLMAAYALALAWLVWQRQVPWWVPGASCLLNLLTFFAYWQDKYAAQQGRWRIREDTLHLWSLAGGWGGAWFAQQVLRHKSVKGSFRATYAATVLLHCAGVAAAWWFWRPAR
ncbi:cold shock and DUF1294 domain-containing protein [Ramlibacter pallidus]|uniref:Cold shock and DUF1294 domain-containing protein n=1 Tax=Ramlibacter pallidus TaxID=2780087 RepID=A0ABR9S7K4_9BURK|nr:cold shock and DUF1294 domain-containing protein [Ramlibacter pallidus]MBE7368987.1 cold shock and DUF1294 domain-containing protein [Ramlibacter pallidus]